MASSSPGCCSAGLGRAWVEGRLSSIRPLSAWREAFQLLQAPHRILLAKHSIIYAAGVEGCPRLVGELLEIREELLDLALDRHEQPDIPCEEIDCSAAFLHAALVGVHAKVGDQCPGAHLPGAGGNIAPRR